MYFSGLNIQMHHSWEHLGILSPWDIVLHGFLSLWGFVPLGFCPPGLLSHLDFVPLGFCPHGFLSSWVFVFLGFCPLGYCPMGFCPVGFCPRTTWATCGAIICPHGHLLLIGHIAAHVPVNSASFDSNYVYMYSGLSKPELRCLVSKQGFASALKSHYWELYKAHHHAH